MLFKTSKCFVVVAVIARAVLFVQRIWRELKLNNQIDGS